MAAAVVIVPTGKTRDVDANQGGFLCVCQSSILMSPPQRRHNGSERHADDDADLGLLVGDVPALLLVAFVLWFLSPTNKVASRAVG